MYGAILPLEFISLIQKLPFKKAYYYETERDEAREKRRVKAADRVNRICYGRIRSFFALFHATIRHEKG